MIKIINSKWTCLLAMAIAEALLLYQQNWMAAIWCTIAASQYIYIRWQLDLINKIMDHHVSVMNAATEKAKNFCTKLNEVSEDINNIINKL